MLHWFFAGLALALGGGPVGESGTTGPALAEQSNDQAYTGEPQTPTGKFTTATEVRPILTATKPDWVAVREFNGQDLLYFTQILSWRCGLVGLHYGVNGGEMRAWDMPPCLTDTAQPNAIRAEDGLPYVAFGPGHVQSVQVEIIYDDLTRDSAHYERSDVLMP
ncbi:hypothetical protein [Roseovarius salinarum]|uniref:hypothetical protein n=1 Tax=Roseovarius salinarum TaxID=1981892 RepID=UPI000C31E223|nr:hypothetical protein [Roseovarius salinarum]